MTGKKTGITTEEMQLLRNIAALNRSSRFSQIRRVIFYTNAHE